MWQELFAESAGAVRKHAAVLLDRLSRRLWPEGHAALRRLHHIEAVRAFRGELEVEACRAMLADLRRQVLAAERNAWASQN